MGHVVLLGDSIFNNAAYVQRGQEVIAQLRDRLPPGWSATLGAVDGAVIADVDRQFGRNPELRDAPGDQRRGKRCLACLKRVDRAGEFGCGGAAEAGRRPGRF